MGKEKLNGEMFVKLVEGDCSVKMDGDIHGCAIMLAGAICAFYEEILDRVKEDVENPKEELKKRLYELVDIAIEGATTKRKLEELNQRAKDIKSPVEALELMLEMAKIVHEHRTGDLK